MTMPAVVLEQSFTYSHATVMVEEVVRYIAPQQGATYLDATVGGGGHAAALLEACPEARLIGLDRDPVAVQAAGERLACFPGRVEVAQVAFDGIFEFLQNKNIVRVQGLVADLGVSGPQLADADRGLSFRLDGPLDMRMDPTRGETARQLIQQLSQEELANVIYQLGEERRSRRVARCIKQALEAGELDTTRDLRRAVVRAVGPQKSGG
ncbi:MAG TPA: 16S rRNA (cytosine(1402)-N(4))-methyltransferase RsmH, partial [Polyangiaceae bacterium]